jgi:putative transferase (TIGR04331 family)
MIRNSHYCLATTAIKDFWDMDSKLMFLGPWCLANERGVFELNNDLIVPSPWRTGYRVKEASDYCFAIYKKILPQISSWLNVLHNVSHPVEYWRVLLGYWLLHFIQMVYDKYIRIEAVLNHNPDFFTYVLPREKCKPISYSYSDFQLGINAKSSSDCYNLKLISLVARELCPEKTVVKDYAIEDRINETKQGLKRRWFNYLKTPFESAFRGKIILSNMYHVGIKDLLKLKIKIGFGKLDFRDFMLICPQTELNLMKRMSAQMRKRLVIESYGNRFETLLNKTISDAIPICYVEDYFHYSNNVKKNINLNLNLLGSAVGWSHSELFKYFAAEAVLKGAELAEFQHGGGYGCSLSIPEEELAVERGTFYSWGHICKDNNKVITLPSPYLSKLIDSYSYNIKHNGIVFVGSTCFKYVRRLDTCFFPDDIAYYFNSMKVFCNTVSKQIKKDILFRSGMEGGWKEIDSIKKLFPEIKLVVKGVLTDLMKKARITVVDYPATSFLEALVINAPTVLYWDHDIFLMRPEAEPYFQLLRDAGILYKDPISAAKKVNEIFDNPGEWWLSDKVQGARKEFCDRFAYARKDWLDVWVRELRKFI